MPPKKSKKGSVPDCYFEIHNIHSDKEAPKTDFIRCVSIDPGCNNFGIRVECRFRKAEADSPFDQRNVELFERWDLKREAQRTKSSVFTISSNKLDQYLDLFWGAHYVIVETQMRFNYEMTLMGQHIVSYFTIRLRDAPFRPSIVKIDSKAKTYYLNAPKESQRHLKEVWGPETAIQILRQRGEEESITKIRNEKGSKGKGKKPDDLSDIVLQLEAFYIRLGFPSPLATE